MKINASADDQKKLRVNFELLPAKRTMKKYKIFVIGSVCCRSFLCSEERSMFFKGCKNTQIALHSLVIVIVDVIGNHLNQFLFAGKSLSIVALAPKNAPKTFHRSVIDALSHT